MAHRKAEILLTVLQSISSVFITLLLLGILTMGFLRKVDCFSAFKQGAWEGAEMVVKLFTNLLGIFVAIQVFKESGALTYLIYLLRPCFSLFGIPEEVAPLVLMRPISGSASLAYVQDILQSYGPDSYVGRAASMIMGSTETIFYTLTVYFGATTITKTRHALWVACMSDFVNVVTGCFLLRRYMGGS